MKYTLSHWDGNARRGRLETPRGVVETPAFMPVGTVGSVRSVSPSEVVSTGAQIILGNTFHLMLRPGTDIINLHGSLHDFMGWGGPILTDSGGFQVWSLANKKDIKEEGVTFRSPVDGSTVFLGPETSMQVQRALGSDIVMCFDECTDYPATIDQARESMTLSLRWAERCRDYQLGPDQALFGIAQGGMHEALRLEALERLQEIGFDGYALGGLSVGEPKEDMLRVLETVTPAMPTNQPRYLMGVGKPEDLLAGVARGIDLFDCVLPTRNARNGWLYTRRGIVRLRNAVNRDDTRAVDPDCPCPACVQFSRAYLRHLHVTGELLGPRLCTLHNLVFFQTLMSDIRDAISSGGFEAFADEFMVVFSGQNADVV
tara:strand:+ start:264 stop:1379 length:1116 start_codon:yes stop_codon:yes gene_type:complete